jgi:sigma-B regulation protein RsbU (phosphoserine phosphatase)
MTTASESLAAWVCSLACTGKLDESLSRLTLSCGGHPLPFLVRASGEVSSAGKPGSLIGVLSDPELYDVSIDLEPGDALVMYTDGVTDERRDGEEFGEGRLKALLERLGPESAERIASEIEGNVLEFRQAPPQDDIAILVIRMSA